MAQRQRAGLITPRSLDQNGLPVYITHRIGASRHWSILSTGMAQRLARGAHNSEVTRSKRVAGIYHTSHWCIKALEHLITGVAQRQRARLITARTYDRNVSPVSITHRIGASRHWSIFHRHGAEAARGAHNSEVTRSKRVAGIYHTSHWCIKALEHLITGMAERKRAWLTNHETYDRNVLPVSFNSTALQKLSVKLDVKRSWH
jgi:hypothetical protein